MKLDVPLFSQSWDLNDWKSLGFESEKEAQYWERSCCGILCLSEIASYFNKKYYNTAKLIKLGQELGGYDDKLGWRHDGLAKLANKLGLVAEFKKLSSQEIRSSLDANKIPIVSIKWAFDPHRSFKEKLLFWRKYGGHLAVVVGYEGGRGFYVNHTSILKNYNRKAWWVPTEQFEKGYTGRAVIVWR